MEPSLCRVMKGFNFRNVCSESPRDPCLRPVHQQSDRHFLQRNNQRNHPFAVAARNHPFVSENQRRLPIWHLSLLTGLHFRSSPAFWTISLSRLVFRGNSLRLQCRTSEHLPTVRSRRHLPRYQLTLGESCRLLVIHVQIISWLFCLGISG
jgi:hypothetical protein